MVFAKIIIADPNIIIALRNINMVLAKELYLNCLGLLPVIE
jgi:hypothetical protein